MATPAHQLIALATIWTLAILGYCLVRYIHSRPYDESEVYFADPFEHGYHDGLIGFHDNLYPRGSNEYAIYETGFRKGKLKSEKSK